MHKPYCLIALRVIVLCLAVACYLPPPSPAQAQSPDEAIVVEQRQADFTIRPNGDVAVQERWQVRVSGGPVTSLVHKVGTNRVEDISDWGVQAGEETYQPGEAQRPGTFSVEPSGNKIELHWFFEPASETTRSFTLRYTLHGALRIYDGGDQFAWVFVEADRAYPVEQWQAVVHLPQTFAREALAVSRYNYGVAVEGGATVTDGQTVEYSGTTQRPGDEWGLFVQFPHGAVNATPPAWQQVEDARAREEAARRAEIAAQEQANNRVAISAAIVLFLVTVVAMVVLWGRLIRVTTIGKTAARQQRTTPPDQLPPALAGTLLHKRPDMHDIIATMVDLAQRGFLRIVEYPASESPDALPHQQRSFRLERGTQPTSGLLPYEHRLLAALFAQGDSRDLDTLRKKFFSRLPRIKTEMHNELIKAGYCLEDPGHKRNRYIFAGIAVTVFAIIGGELSASIGSSYHVPLAFLIPLSTLPFGIGLFVLSALMHMRTPSGLAAAQQWQDFRRYLEQGGPTTRTDGTANPFEAYLPYAIAFAIEEAWVARFATADTPAPGWYAPPQPAATLGEVREGVLDMLRQSAAIFASS
jgi:uncharacterized membrane protein